MTPTQEKASDVYCYFCGSNIETMKDDEYIKSQPHINIDRYFKDKRCGKTICKICGPHYMERQFFDNNPIDDVKGFEKFVLANFERIMLK